MALPMTENFWLFFAVALLLGLLCGWLIGRLQAAGKLRRDLENERQTREKLQQDLVRFEAQLAAERQSSREKLEMLDDNRRQLEKSFQALSSQALSANNRNFLDLAKTTLDSYQQQAKNRS